MVPPPAPPASVDDDAPGHPLAGARDGLRTVAYASVVALAVVELAAQGSSPALLASQLVGVVVAAVGVALRRRLPWLLPLGGALTAVTGQTTLLVLGLLSYGVRRRGAGTWAIALLGVTAALSPVSLDSPWRQDADGGYLVLAVAARVLVVVALPLLAGAYVGARRALVEGYRERALLAERERATAASNAVLVERHRIARDMHDVVGHRLALVSLQAGALEAGASDEQTRREAAAVRATAAAALDELRATVATLDRTDTGADTRTAATGPDADLVGIEALVGDARAAGCDVTLLAPALDRTPPPPAEVARAAHRVVREALTNALRHAPGAPVSVLLTGRPGGVLTTHVACGPPPPADPGGRPPVPDAAPRSGTGLAGLAQRVRLVGGTFEAGRQDGDFVVRTDLPWEAAPGPRPPVPPTRALPVEVP